MTWTCICKESCERFIHTRTSFEGAERRALAIHCTLGPFWRLARGGGGPEG